MRRLAQRGSEGICKATCALSPHGGLTLSVKRFQLAATVLSGTTVSLWNTLP